MIALHHTLTAGHAVVHRDVSTTSGLAALIGGRS